MPRQVDHDAYRAELVERCTELFAKHGYTALTMRKIATHLGVSTGTLYHYFPNKEALFKGVVHSVAARDMLDARSAIGVDIPREARARAVLTYVELMETYFLQQNLVLIDFFRTQDPEAVVDDPEFRRAKAFYHGAVADVLGIDEARAQAILIFLKGLIFQRLYDGGATKFEDQAPYVEALLEAS